MRARTVVSFAAGAAAGAGWMYLKDPDHGPARRRDVRRQALRQARMGAVGLARQGRRRAEDLALAAVAGFAQGRDESRDVPGGRLALVDDRRAS
jgi:hypothetical protein